MEHECSIVSSRGLLKSCNIYNTIINSSDVRLEKEQYLAIQKNDIVYVNSSALENFFHNIYPFIKEPFILVSGDSDVSVINLYNINDTKIIHWYAQNLLTQHPKATIIPIEQEKMLCNIKNKANPLCERYFACYSNFHHSIWGIGERGDRKEAISLIDKKIVYFEPSFVTREMSWDIQSKFIFVLSPKGGGYDCHRTWEALCLGCIPIVKTSPLDPLYDNLPVCIVESWSDVNETFLTNYLTSIQNKTFHYEKLLLEYWVNLIKGSK
jgi:hypothetical protein